MRFTPIIFSRLLAAIDRRQFNAIVTRAGGDAYDKRFRSWDHLVAMIFAQFSAATSLRGLEASFNAHSQHHYHLGVGRIARSTLADANKRRPLAVFADTFSMLAGQLDRIERREGKELLRLIDSTPIPLGKLCAWAQWNGRIRGMKAHIVYDPNTDCPRLLDITHATVNDAQIGRTISIEAGATYVFDKGYCHYGWWTAIAVAGAVFVTRPKTNMKLVQPAGSPDPGAANAFRDFRRKSCTRINGALVRLTRRKFCERSPQVGQNFLRGVLDIVCLREVEPADGDGFTVLEDAEVSFASKGDSKLPIKLRRVTVQRHQNGAKLELLTNDLERSAVAIAQLYKTRWQIELLFRWMKQHLRIRAFLGNNEHAIRLQIVAAMIAYVLIRIAAKARCVRLPVLRLLELVGQCLFDRRHFETIDRPPPVNPNRKRDHTAPNQMSFLYA